MPMNIDSKYLFDFDLWDGRISFDRWNLNDFGKLASKTFEDGLKNTLQNEPPCMLIEPNENSDDLDILFWVQALGDGDNGPCWQFSMKDTFRNIDSDYSNEDQEIILKSLIAVTEYVRALVKGQN